LRFSAVGDVRYSPFSEWPTVKEAGGAGAGRQGARNRAPVVRGLGRRALQRRDAHPAIDSDPLLASLRATAEFQEIRAAALECRKYRPNEDKNRDENFPPP